MKNIAEKDTTVYQLHKGEQIVKRVDKRLLAERIAVEVKAHLELCVKCYQKFDNYLETSRDKINYTNEEELEILEIAKNILKTKYKIKVISENPFVIFDENNEL